MNQLATHTDSSPYLPPVPCSQARCEQLVRQYRKVKRIEALERDNERHAMRELDWFIDDDECLVLKGRFTPEQGMLIKKVLERMVDEDFLEQPADMEKEPISQRRADALVRMARATLSA